MRVSEKAWSRCSAAYRALVAAQTLAWASVAFTRVILRQRRPFLPVAVTGTALITGGMVSLAVGLLAYFRRGAPPRREAIVVTWISFQIASFLALGSYAISGATLSFLAGMLLLALMHVVSPNRFRPNDR